MALKLKKICIKDLGKVFTGSTPPTKDSSLWGDDFLFVKPSDMLAGARHVYSTEKMLSSAGSKTAKGRLLPAGTTSVVCIGTIGKVCQLHEDAATNQQINSIVVNQEEFDKDYVYYLMTQSIPKVKVVEGGSASGREHVKKSTFELIELDILPLDAQKRIGKLASNYDNLIENNNRRIAILEEMAQSLYREWFVKFRFPGHELCQMIESPLGLIPEGWRSSPLGELVHFKRKSVKKGKLENPTPYMGLEHFPRKSFALTEWDVTTEIGSSKLAFEKGDILFGKIRPYFHKVGVAQTNGLCSSDTFVLSAIDAKYSNLIAMVTFSESFVAHAVQTSQGTKMPRANWDVLSEYYVALAPDELLGRFNGIVGPAIEQVRVLGAKNRNLKKQRDLLLPKLISGQFDLSKAEQASA